METTVGQTRGLVEGMLSWVEYAATGIELLAVAIIVVVIIFATVMYAMRIMTRKADMTTVLQHSNNSFSGEL